MTDENNVWGDLPKNSLYKQLLNRLSPNEYRKLQFGDWVQGSDEGRIIIGADPGAERTTTPKFSTYKFTQGRIYVDEAAKIPDEEFATVSRRIAAQISDNFERRLLGFSTEQWAAYKQAQAEQEKILRSWFRTINPNWSSEWDEWRNREDYKQFRVYRWAVTIKNWLLRQH